MKFRLSVVLSLLTLAIGTSASAVTVGHMSTGGTSYFSSPTGVITLINTAYPALEAGSVSTASVLWTNAPSGGCSSVFKVKFLRATSPFGFTVLATRGPFNAVNGNNQVSIVPAVNLVAGDVIAVTQLYNCGGAAHANVDDTITSFNTNTDPSSSVTGLYMTRGWALSARASTALEVVAGHLPLATNGPGPAGTSQRTGMQLTNLDATWIYGRLVFHPASAVASPSDPSIDYAIPPGQTISSDDIVGLLGATTGGTMDVLVYAGPAPRVETRIYKDTGAGTGTLGDYEDLEHPQSKLQSGDRATLTTPANLTNFSLTIGVRTLASSASIMVWATNASGALVAGPVTRNYVANYMEEVPASTFLGAAVPAHGIIYVSVNSGSLMLFGTTADLLTNDANTRMFVRK